MNRRLLLGALLVCTTAFAVVKSPPNPTAIAGVTNGSAPPAGSVGEVVYSYCTTGGTNTSVTVTSVTNGTPAVVTWPAAMPAAAAGVTNWTCPIYLVSFSTAPNGYTASTQYWIVGSTVNSGASTFSIADTAAHALAGTTSCCGGGSVGLNVVMTIGLQAAITNTAYATTQMNIGAGDWLCSGAGQLYNTSSSATTTGYFAAIQTTPSLRPASGLASMEYTNTYFASQTAPTSIMQALPISGSLQYLSGTTTLDVVDAVSSGAPTNFYLGGGMRCLRVH